MAPSTITSVNPSDPSGKLTGNALRICVFCASRPGSSPAYLSAARSLAHAIYSQNHTLLYGAGNRGLMGEVARTMSKLGGKVEGVIPRALMKREVKKPENGDVEDEAVVQEEDGGDVEDVIGEVTIVESMHERKAYMAEHGDAFVALPGGFGTLDELVEIITWVSVAASKGGSFMG